jgi:hypothetical protein
MNPLSIFVAHYNVIILAEENADCSSKTSHTAIENGEKYKNTGDHKTNQERKNDSEEENYVVESKQHPKITVSFLKLYSYNFCPGISI